MIGPPGSGKTMLAKRLAGILPMMAFEEAIESTRIHSIAGTLPSGGGLLWMRPFRAPHHTISDAGMIGGGAGMPRPGEVSLAHNGLLFLDEFPEFPRNVLEILRQPLEDSVVSIARAAMTLNFPASFMLVAAMNPCPCGFYGDPTRECRCTPAIIPLIDRIDIQIEVPAVPYKELRAGEVTETSAGMRARVEKARERQMARGCTNSRMPTRLIRQQCALDETGERTLEMAMKRMSLSARAHDRILKVARTIADLDESASIAAKHIAEAIQYRSLDRNYWT
jgi:magnesium chelatase family protein